MNLQQQPQRGGPPRHLAAAGGGGCVQLAPAHRGALRVDDPQDNKEIVPMVLAHAGPLPLAGRPGLPEVESAAAGLLRGSGRPLAGQGRCCVSPYRPSHEGRGSGAGGQLPRITSGTALASPPAGGSETGVSRPRAADRGDCHVTIRKARADRRCGRSARTNHHGICRRCRWRGGRGPAVAGAAFLRRCVQLRCGLYRPRAVVPVRVGHADRSTTHGGRSAAQPQRRRGYRAERPAGWRA